MKIPPRDTENFCRRLPETINAVLIYGPDSGLVEERATLIARQIVEDLSDPFRVTQMSGESLKENSALSDEMASMSFSGGRRLIRLKQPGNGVANTIKDAVEHNTGTEASFLLVTEGELPPKAALRKWFESSDKAAAIACYVEDVRDVGRVIADRLREAGYAWNDDVIPLLAAHATGDRLMARRLLEKLQLYMGDLTHITFEDASVCVGDTNDATLDDVCQALAAGNQGKVERVLRKALQQGIMPVSILRSATRYFLRLQYVGGLVEQGQGPDQAIKSLYPPVFFKQVPIFKAHLNRWNRQKTRITKALSLLYDAEHISKQTGGNPELICSRCLMRIASLA